MVTLLWVFYLCHTNKYKTSKKRYMNLKAKEFFNGFYSNQMFIAGKLPGFLFSF